jgi:hypothetical protein
MSRRWPRWAEISIEELVRLRLLLPRPGERVPRRILRVPRPDAVRAPAQPVRWSGERGLDLTIPIFARAGRKLIGYCARGDAWTSDPRVVYG